MTAIQIGKKKKGRILFQYKDVTYDVDRWADANLFHPYEYDLCLLKIKDCKKDKKGYWTGQFWDGLNVKQSDIVLYWKRFTESID